MSPPGTSNARPLGTPTDEAPRLPKRRFPRPAVDERLVMPETRYEVIDGKVTYVPPADEWHGTRHSKVSSLLEAYVAPGYEAASDMLTRTSVRGDMAPDASVYPSARDPRTGGRQLEELAFEVLSTERLGHAAKKARALSARGVRRVFGIDVERRRALEWSPTTNTWEILAPDGAIEDRALVLPLPLEALVEASRTDDAVARALVAKKNPVIEGAIQEAAEHAEQQGKEQGKKLGVLEGKIASLLGILSDRGIRVPKKAEKRIRAVEDEAQIDAWRRRALTCASVAEMFGE
jgi:Uma2 family endonuclease